MDEDGQESSSLVDQEFSPDSQNEPLEGPRDESSDVDAKTSSLAGETCIEHKVRSGGEDELDFEDEGEEESDARLPGNRQHLIQSEERRRSDAGEETGEDGEVPDSDEEGQVKTSSPSKKQPNEEEDDEELEEGEVKDEEEEEESIGPTAQVCKFWNKGTCTWGDACRFVHEGQVRTNRSSNSNNNRSQAIMGGLKGPRGGFPPSMPASGLLTLPVMPAVDAAASSWERGFRSAKERVERAKERKENDEDFDDKKLNLSTSSEEVDAYGRSQRHSSSYVPPPPPRDPYPARDSRRSPSPGRHHYSSSHHYPRESHASHHHHSSYPDESEYERRQRLAYMSAPRPEEWSERPRESRGSGSWAVDKNPDRPSRQYDHSERRYDEFGNRIRPPPPPGHPAAEDYVPPATDRFGRIRPEEYVDRFRRSPNRTGSTGGRGDSRQDFERRASDLSSISGSNTGSGLSGSSLSDSDGSWSDVSDDKNKRKRRTLKTKTSNVNKVPPDAAIVAATGVASTSGMKRIPKLSERGRENREQIHAPSREAPDTRHSRSPFDDGQVSRYSNSSRERQRDYNRPVVADNPVSRDFDRHSSGSESDSEMMSASHSRRRKGTDDLDINPRKRSKRESGDSHDLSSVSPTQSPSSPVPPQRSQRKGRDKFVMDFDRKVPRIQPTEATNVLSRRSSSEEDVKSSSPKSDRTPSHGKSPQDNSVEKSLERKRLLEQLKAVEAAIAAKKQPGKTTTSGKSSRTTGKKLN